MAKHSVEELDYLQLGKVVHERPDCACRGEPERHWIETDNNGLIVPCPMCNPNGVIPRDHSPALDVIRQHEKL